uniref:Uncharacterized protein n=1 Tax=Entomoneis paludosa TaxID=265537 RepID=A0A7S2YPP8_9STRA
MRRFASALSSTVVDWSAFQTSPSDTRKEGRLHFSKGRRPTRAQFMSVHQITFTRQHGRCIFVSIIGISSESMTSGDANFFGNNDGRSRGIGKLTKSRIGI